MEKFRLPPTPVDLTDPIECGFIDDNNRYIAVYNPRIVVSEDFVPGIYGWHQGKGHLEIYVRSGQGAVGSDTPGVKDLHFHPLDHGRYAARTRGDGDYNLGEESHGIQAEHTGYEGRVGVDFRNLSLSTAGGDFASGIYVSHKGGYVWEAGEARRGRGAVVINVVETERDRGSRARPLIGTRGDESDAIRAEYTRAAAYGHIVITVEGYTIATGGIVPPGPQFSRTGKEGGELIPVLAGYESRGIYASHEGLGDIRISVTDNHLLTWGLNAHGIFADHVGKTITERTCKNGRRGVGIRIGIDCEEGDPSVTTGGGVIDIDLKDGEIRTAGDNSIGVYGSHRGGLREDDDEDADEGATIGGVSIDATGVIVATAGKQAHGIQAWIRQNVVGDDNPVAGTGEGDLAITVTRGAVSTEGDAAYAIHGRHDNTGGVTVTVTGDASTAGARSHAIVAEHRGSRGDVALTVSGGDVSTRGDGAHGVYAKSASGGAVTVAVTGGSVTTGGVESHGVLALNTGGGDVTVRTTGGAITATDADSHGIEAHSTGGDVTVAIDGGAVVARGEFGAGVLARSFATQAGKGNVRVTVSATGRVSAASGIGIYSDGPRDLNVSVGNGGRVEGDIFHAGAGALIMELPERGVVTGTVHDPKGPLTVRGSIGRLFYSSGAAVTVAPGGKLTGVEIVFEGEKQVQALRSTAGEVTVAVQGSVTGNIVADGDSRLAVTVTGTVDGDLVQTGDGAFTLTVPEGGVVTGTVYDPVSPFTVDGSIGRLFYSAGGTATVARTGKLTGVETTVNNEKRVQAIRSASGNLTVTTYGPVTGDIGAVGNLTATVHNAVTGDIGVVGDLTATVHGTVTGDIGADGNLTATVRGKVTGDIIGAGKGRLAVTVTGAVDGAIRAQGTGDHSIVLERGGRVTAPGRRASTVAATADGAGSAAVGTDAAHTDEAIVHRGGNLRATLRGAVDGDIVSRSGRLAATVAGTSTVDGDLSALGTGNHVLMLEAGSRVTGTVRRATPGTITAGGTVGRLWFDRGGLAVIGEKGEILGIDDNAVRSERGELVVEVRQAAGEDRLAALRRAFVDRMLTIVEKDGDGMPVIQTRAPGEEARVLGAPGQATSIPDGAYDLGVVLKADGSVDISREFAPRSRLYEALPSVLLTLNEPLTVAERAAAPRDSNGVWGRLEGARGSWTAERSTTGAEYDLQRHGVWTGLESPLDGAGPVVGLSVHHRGGKADVPRGGDIEAQGFGVTMHGNLHREGLYLDGQAAATWYSTAFESSARGRLTGDIKGYGYALGLEAGRRMDVGMLTVTPRARLIHSEVSVSNFEDKTGARVSLNDGRSLRGRVGLGVEAQPLGSRIRLSGGVDVEREFEDARQVTVGGTEQTALPATERATRFLVGLGGSTGWNDGRFTLSGKVDYATGEDGESTEFGGGLNLTVRF